MSKVPQNFTLFNLVLMFIKFEENDITYGYYYPYYQLSCINNDTGTCNELKNIFHLQTRFTPCDKLYSLHIIFRSTFRKNYYERGAGGRREGSHSKRTAFACQSACRERCKASPRDAWFLRWKLTTLIIPTNYAN